MTPTVWTGGRTGLGAQRFETPEAAWEAAWKEGRRLVKLYQADMQVASLPLLLLQADGLHTAYRISFAAIEIMNGRASALCKASTHTGCKFHFTRVLIGREGPIGSLAI